MISTDFFLRLAQKTFYDFFIEVLEQIATEVITLLPKIILAVVVLVIAILVIKLLSRLVGRVLKLVDIDGMFERLVKTKLPFSLSSLIIFLINLGIILVALFGIAYFFLGPQQMELMREVLAYSARIISVIVVTIFTLIMFDVIIDRVNVETRMRGYILFILLILITMMIIDLTALSDSTKTALGQGLSIGIGIAVGVFAVWFFFHDYFDKLIGLKKAPAGEESKSQQNQE